MSRPPRISFPGAHYHLFNRFVDRHPFFQDEMDYRYFLKSYFELAPLHGVRTYAYCLMPNHFHMVIKTECGGLSQFLHRFLFRVARGMNRSIGRAGHLFQDRAKTLLIEDAGYFETVVGYVLLNPVRAGLCRDVLKYPWASAGAMVGESAFPVERHQLAERVSGRTISPADAEKQREVLLHWMKQLEAASNMNQFSEGIRGTFGGSSEFRKKVLLENERRMRFEDVRQRRCTDRDFASVTWEEMGEMAEKLCIAAPQSLTTAWKNLEKCIHDMRVLLAHRVAHWTYDQIQSHEHDRKSLFAYSVALHRVDHNSRKRALAEQVLARVV